MEATFCPRCHESVEVQTASPSLIRRCPACGIRILHSSSLLTTDPAYKSAIASGPPSPPAPHWDELPEVLPYLTRVLRRVRRWRGDAPLPDGAHGADASRPESVLYFLYTWLPALMCAFFLAFLPTAVLSFFADRAGPFGPVPIVVVNIALVAFGALAACILWYRSRGGSR
jgi:hypothetical protein